MFSTTFRPNGAQIKIRKGACPRDHDMRSPQSCSPLRTRLPPASSASTARSPLPAEGSSPPSAGILAAAGAGDQAESDWDGELRERRAGSLRARGAGRNVSGTVRAGMAPSALQGAAWPLANLDLSLRYATIGSHRRRRSVDQLRVKEMAFPTVAVGVTRTDDWRRALH
jgi:hypothetical protein